MSDKIVYLTDESFDSEVLKAEGPVLVDFWADYCTPCKAIAPLLDAIADEYEGRITIAKLDVTAYRDAAIKHGIRNIPTLLVFKNGQVVATQVGGLSKTQLKAFVDANL